jgi:uncharacterized membrane protein YdjX (TVP38/TMEM64 family)
MDRRSTIERNIKMENFIPQWIPLNTTTALFISVILNILIAISGVVPSAFLTAWNITFFGFSNGLMVSIIGEAAGAIISFILYRKGLSKLTEKLQSKNRLVAKLKSTENLEGIFLVLVLRVLPFVPSGAVTLAAAISKMGIISFSIASTVGKIPSLLIEAYSVHKVLQFKTEWQIGLLAMLVISYMIYLFLKKK